MAPQLLLLLGDHDFPNLVFMSIRFQLVWLHPISYYYHQVTAWGACLSPQAATIVQYTVKAKLLWSFIHSGGFFFSSSFFKFIIWICWSQIHAGLREAALCFLWSETQSVQGFVCFVFFKIFLLNHATLSSLVGVKGGPEWLWINRGVGCIEIPGAAVLTAECTNTPLCTRPL